MGLEFILLADNEKQYRDAKESAFIEAGYTPENGYKVKSFKDAETLQRFYEKHGPQTRLIVTDNQMGRGKPGIELAREIGEIVFVLSYTPKLKERAKNDPGLPACMSEQIFSKQDPEVYKKIINAAVASGRIRNPYVTETSTIIENSLKLAPGQTYEVRLKEKEDSTRNLAVIGLIKELYEKMQSHSFLPDKSYVSCVGETYNTLTSVWELGDLQNVVYEIKHEGKTLTVTRLSEPRKRLVRKGESVGVFVDTTMNESKLYKGLESQLREKPGTLYGIFGDMLSARHFSRHSGFYTSNIN